MLEALRDLDEALRRGGGRLFLRRGDPVREAIAVARECGAGALHVSADWRGGLHAQPGADDRRLLPLKGPLLRLATGAWHFWDLLTDGEIASNAGNWQWMAGTGNDTRPNRVLNPVRQVRRFDPEGHYVRRYLPELEQVRDKAIFEPWRMEGFDRLDYPPPLVDHDEPRQRSGRSAKGRCG